VQCHIRQQSWKKTTFILNQKTLNIKIKTLLLPRNNGIAYTCPKLNSANLVFQIMKNKPTILIMFNFNQDFFSHVRFLIEKGNESLKPY